MSVIIVEKCISPSPSQHFSSLYFPFLALQKNHNNNNITRNGIYKYLNMFSIHSLSLVVYQFLLNDQFSFISIQKKKIKVQYNNKPNTSDYNYVFLCISIPPSTTKYNIHSIHIIVENIQRKMRHTKIVLLPFFLCNNNNNLMLIFLTFFI